MQYNADVALELPDMVNAETDRPTDKPTEKQTTDFVSGGRNSKQVEIFALIELYHDELNQSVKVTF